MRAAPCGGAATRRRTFISWAEWLCDSLSISFCFSSSLSSSSRGLCVILSIFLGPFSPSCWCQWVHEAPHTVNGRPMNEWGEVEVNCGEIWDELWGNPWHRLYRFHNSLSLSLCLTPPPILFFFSFSLPSRFYALALVTGPPLNLVALSLTPFLSPSLLTWNIHFWPMKYGEGPHELFTG